MVKVITYGTYDLLHYGHIRLLERAKALGDYLIVGVTADAFDQARGKINVQQSLVERIEAVRATGLADEIIVEEYDGQKIDDIRRYGIDIFAIGSDWEGHFDYLRDYCRVVYLPRTEGVSSTDLRTQSRNVRIGLVGELNMVNKFEAESHFVNGVTISGFYAEEQTFLSEAITRLPLNAKNLDELLDVSDAVYIVSHPAHHYSQVRQALLRGKHVICEAPTTLLSEQWDELTALAQQQGCILMDSVKTAYSLAYSRLLLMAKSGKIGRIVSVDAVCTSLTDLALKRGKDLSNTWNSMCQWGPTALLPVFQLLGTDFVQKSVVSHYSDEHDGLDLFTKVSFVYPHAVASIKVGKGVKSEGELIISGTEGYIYVPAPWWKTSYFEIRFENPADNLRYFYQNDGEGIRYMIISFLQSIARNEHLTYIQPEVSRAIVSEIDYFTHSDNVVKI
ncbi:MAG: adenylyltransferase/cytidyltransferase family protein [Alloprevotella sp.]|nr:adenylyltransferase/cytidyltransferase family protein [Alloprevotella sp.]